MDSFGILFFNQKDNCTAVNVHRFGRLSGFQCETDHLQVETTACFWYTEPKQFHSAGILQRYAADLKS